MIFIYKMYKIKEKKNDQTLLTLIVCPVNELSSNWAVIKSVPLLRLAVTDSSFESVGSLICLSSLQLLPVLILMIPFSRVMSRAASLIESEIGIEATHKFDLYSHSI